MKKVIAITPELRIILACAETIEIEVDESSELAEAKDHIAQQQERISALLEQRNRMGQDVQNAAITGRVPELHPIGAQLGLVANLRAKVAELEAKAAIGRRAVEALRAIEWSRPVLNRYGFWTQGCIECERERDSGHTEKCATAAILSAILRDAEQAESSNNKVILGSSDYFRGATKMIADRQLADAVNKLTTVAIAYFGTEQLRERIAGVVHGLVRGEPATVAVDAGALAELRVTVEAYDKAWADDMPQRQKIAALHMAEAARRLLAGGE